MVQAFLQEHAGDARYEGVTFASIGYGADTADPRIVNLVNDNDVVLGLGSGLTEGNSGDDNILYNGLDSLFDEGTSHSLDLYDDEVAFLHANGIDIAQISGTAGLPDFDSIFMTAYVIDENAGVFAIGTQAETLDGTSAADLMLGGDGNDQISGRGGDDYLLGGAGNDTIFAGAGSDTVVGGDGNDALVGNADPFASEADTLNGGSGNDTIYAESTDTISGGAGFDVLYQVNDNPMTVDLGATGIEYMQAGFNADTINAATQTAGVEVYAGGGNDTITGSNLADFIFAGVGNDTVVGNDGNDVILGDLGSDSLSGGAGNDSIYADNTDSFIDGGSGFDALYIVTSGANSNGMSIDMAATHFEFVADFFGGNDTIDGSGLSVAAEVYAGGGNDTVTGGSVADFLWGGSGDDVISGGAGNDVLVCEFGVRCATRWSRVRRALRLGGRW